jgi:two-component system response regulator WspF
VTTSVAGNAAKVFDAMGYGALDVVRIPVLGPSGDMAGAQAFLDKIATIEKLIGYQRQPVHRPKRETPSTGSGVPNLVALASSTGGPHALAVILSSFPRRSDTAVVIVQHLDMQFAEGLAEWLNEQSRFHVILARQAMRIEPGMAFLAATNDHLVLAVDLTLRYTREPIDNPYRPSVDTFFGSLRKHWPTPGVAVLLTGMGNDGAGGLLALYQAGWHTIAQDQNSSIIYGMPGTAVRMGAAAEVLPLPEIARAILRQLDREKSTYVGR